MLGFPVLKQAGGGCEEVNQSVTMIWLVVKTSPGSHFMGKTDRCGPIKTSDSENLECAWSISSGETGLVDGCSRSSIVVPHQPNDLDLWCR